jgi:hypothetical protein
MSRCFPEGGFDDEKKYMCQPGDMFYPDYGCNNGVLSN